VLKGLFKMVQIMGSRRPLALWLLAYTVAASGCSRIGGETTLSPDEAELCRLVDSVSKDASLTKQSTKTSTPSDIIQGALALGLDAVLWDHELKEFISYHHYFLHRANYLSAPMDDSGRETVRVRKGKRPSEFERHPNEFLAYFAQLGLPRDSEFQSEGRSFTINDMLNSTKRTFRRADEATYTLVALALYDDKEKEWKNEEGELVTFRDIVTSELEADPTNAACGGTHSFFALACASRKLNPNDGAERPLWRKVQDRLESEVQRAQRAQLSDGSIPFSDHGHDPGGEAGLHAKIYATGHSLEWLVCHLRKEELHSEWIQNAVRFLCRAAMASTFDPPPASTWFHCLHGLNMYRNKICGGPGATQ
jgi:hypothetical protein